MKRVIVLTFFLSVFLSGFAGAAAGTCETVAFHTKDVLRIDVPPGMRPTRNVVGFLVDTDSTGAVAKTSLELSSGDIALDIFTRNGIERTAFIPESRNCVAFSHRSKFGIGLSAEPTYPADSLTAKDATPDCAREVVTLFAEPAPPGDPRRGTASGRAIVTVTVDENGRVAETALTRSADNALLDAEAVRVARASKYTVQTSTACPAGPRTAIADLTFFVP